MKHIEHFLTITKCHHSLHPYILEDFNSRVPIQNAFFVVKEIKEILKELQYGESSSYEDNSRVITKCFCCLGDQLVGLDNIN